MLLIDIYLQQHNLKRYDVAKKTGISQQVLSNARNKGATDLPIKVVKAIADTVGKTPGALLDELIALENEGRTYVASDLERFMIGLENQEEYIIITGELLEKARPIINTQISNIEKDVFEFGFRGLMPLVSAVTLGVQKLTGNFSDEDKIERMLSNYNIVSNAKEEIILQDRRAEL